MANVYKEKFRLRVSDYDKLDQVLISSILDLCQDVAGKHAIELGVGYDDMIVRDIIWMIIRSKVRIIKNPPFSSNVVVKTWPSAPGRLDMEREYLILSEDEKEEYVHVTSKWVLCSNSTRRLLRAKEAEFKIDNYLEDKLFNESFDKVSFDENKELKTSIVKTNYLELDHNGHINNVKYANFMMLGIEEIQNKAIKNFQIDYLHELKANEDVVLNYYVENNTIYVKGSSLNEDSFIAKIEIE